MAKFEFNLFAITTNFRSNNKNKMDDLPLPTIKAVFDEQPIGNNNRLMID